ncbi:MAG: alkaline phosphatase [Verrucomicrobiales bacterium]|nr:alkaline phosphatase [Verrucomicrobiales bacterium]
MCLALGLGAFSSIAQTPKLVVAILVDQFRYDYLERFDRQFAKNGFNLFVNKGVFMTYARYNYCPTVTGPGHASFLSGSTPALHGIIANDWIDKKTKKQIYCCDDSSVFGVGTATNLSKMSPRNFIGSNFADQMRLHYQSKVVGISMKDRGAILPAGKKPAGAYWFESKSGNFVTSSYYRQELPNWVAEFNSRKRAAQFTGATWNRLLNAASYQYPDGMAGEGRLAGETNSVFPHRINYTEKEGFEAIMPTPYGNQVLEEFAEATVEAEKLGQGSSPDLLCISFSAIDYAGHKFGPYSQEVQDVTLRLDRQLASFFTYLDKKIGLANVEMVLTADHGVTPTPEFSREQGLDGQRFNELEFMVELMSRLNARFGPGKYFIQPKLYGGNLFFNHDTLHLNNASPEDVSSFIRDFAFASGFFQACYSRGQLLEGRTPGMIGRLAENGYNPERGGDMMLILKPFILPLTGKTGTTHGTPYNQDTHVPVLFYGSGFKKGRYADEFYITDIVPTLCASLHMDEPSGCVGKPFVKVLMNP